VRDGECPAGVSVDVECFRLPPGSVEGKHQLAAKAFAQGVPPDELRELLDDVVMATEGEVSLEPLLERRQVQLLEPGDLLLGERVIGELDERRAAPERQSIPQCFRRPVGIARYERFAAGIEQASKAVEVELALLDAEQVAVAAGQQDPFARAVQVASRVCRGSRSVREPFGLERTSR
jgi:hypothetical protein